MLTPLSIIGRIGLSPQKMLHVASVNPRDLCMISCSHSD